MRGTRARTGGERGSVLLVVVVFLATAIAGLAAISSGRTVSATRSQKVMEDESRAFNSAYAQIHMAMNVVNNSGYNEANQNLELRSAVAGQNGGTVKDGPRQLDNTNGGEKTGYEAGMTWLDDEDDPNYGLIRTTNVRVYRAREYIGRLQRLNGEQAATVDPGGLSDSYYVLEAAGRVRDTVRLVSALVRENEPFSSFVFFQNRATLGVSGAPRGLIHSNEKLAFYFSGGSYVDSVSSVQGFDYLAGATPQNTNLRDANPEAMRIDLEKVDFAELKGKANLFVGEEGLDAEIKLYGSGKVRVRQYTPPRFEMVTKSRTYRKKVGWHWETYTKTEQVQVGEKEVEYQDKVFDHYEYETYMKTVKVKVGERTETRYRDVQVKVGTRQVKKTKQEPVYEEQTVTKTRKVKVWVPYNDPDAGGGTSVGGGGDGEGPGEWQWVDEEYETTEMVQVGTKTVEYWVEEPVYETRTEAYTVTVNLYEWQEVEKTRKIPVYKTVTKTRMEPVYEEREVEKRKKVKDYETITETWEKEAWIEPVRVSTDYIKLGDAGGTIYIDGRVTRLYGDLKGRLTIVGNERVRVTGNIRYVDDDGETAMSNGGDYTQKYERNPDYQGNSVLGVIAREDIVMTRQMPTRAEINGTLMSVNGRVGIDGFWADEYGELVKDSSRNREKHLTPEQREIERAYDKKSSYRTRRFRKDSLRRIGGIISNNRVMETFIKTGKDGMSYVDAGFKRGNMKFDINLLFNPPPNFVEVPRPVLTYFVPILMVRNNDA